MRLSKVVLGRCPHCLEGPIFASTMRMNERCPECHIKFEREQGYFMMAIFIGYIISFAIIIPELLLLYWLLDPAFTVYLVVSTLTLLMAAPFIFRYSRIIWLHVDELLDPRKTEQDKQGELSLPHGIGLMPVRENKVSDPTIQE